MAYYGNKDTGEINPSNFATRPGIIVGNGPMPQSDYLFGANMGLTHLENNLNISNPGKNINIKIISHESIRVLSLYSEIIK